MKEREWKRVRVREWVLRVGESERVCACVWVSVRERERVRAIKLTIVGIDWHALWRSNAPRIDLSDHSPQREHTDFKRFVSAQGPYGYDRL